ncbi:probable cytochrome P450 9f2 [Sitodiplosis mosellana]|uniref:probable cytochrome P450 9f2 n=1 Tax=Sitodiplosis mosellana TaxID=263140 RepID=UPI0024440A26|nr:probable cytochrome P450 9f2 [Sitodiplosis mosellana]
MNQNFHSTVEIIVRMVLYWIWDLFSASNILLVILTLTILLVYNFIFKNWWYFSDRNTKFIRGWPLVGSLHEFFFGKLSFTDTVTSFYRKFPNESFFGIYELTHPIFIVRDPDLIKKITVNDFEHFLNHQGSFDDHLDSLLSRSLFFSRNQKWKDMRSILTASFTANKMRMMFDLVVGSTNKFVATLRNQNNAENDLEFELKDLFTRYTTNVIATTAFGLEVDALTDRENEFYLAGKKITNFDGIQGLKLLLLDVIPNVIKLLRIHFLDEGLCNYFRSVVLSTMKYREQNNVFRPDMIHLMMQARKGTLHDDGDTSAVKKYDWEDDDLVAQCAVFFFAGFETSSTLLSFMAHELACNPSIQQKLYDDIIAIEKQLGGQPVTYETMKDFKYMEMVVSETLRMWPPLSQFDRQVTKPYRLEGNDGTVVQLTTRDAVWIPVYGIHMDPKYWEDPTRFDPERFNDENRKNIRSGTYLPFGNGQRTCIASRFGMMVAKKFFFHLLRELRIEKCNKTPDPVILKPNSINMHPKDGFWVRFVPRNWDDDDLVAQCAVFFFAGFETSSTLLSFMAHELACNPSIQEKLYEDIIAIEKQLDGQPVTYETIKDFKYMEMVVSETLRMWPTLSQVVEGNDGTVVQLTTRDAVWIPIHGIHMDPTYWKDPTRFDPERFNDENRKNFRGGTYLPFGSGQRICIAARFVMMVAKTFFFHLLRKLRIEKCDKTPDPVILKPDSINMHPIDGFWVRFVPRN